MNQETPTIEDLSTLPHTLKAEGGPFKLRVPEHSEWECALFGTTFYHGITYRPLKGDEPNWFARWMMKVCFNCTWRKNP